MAHPLSQTLIQTFHPPLFSTNSPPPTSRLSPLPKLLQTFTASDEIMPFATVHARISTPNFTKRKLGSSEDRVEKIMHSFRYLASRLSETHQTLSSSQHKHLGVDEIKNSMSEESHDICRMQPVYDIIVEGFAAHEGRIITPAMALIVANVVMLTTPFVALADTCTANKSVYEMPILLSVALVGATVGGLLARQRKEELKKVNEQLRQINAALRRQAKIESYAPALSYAPVGGRIPDEIIVDPKKEELISHLKAGKNFLRNQDPERAFVEFKAALDLAQNLADSTEEKKAARGLGASLQRQGKYKDAIKYHSMVLAISDREREESGNTEAYGAIADCYTEIGDLEGAGKFYDKYIAQLEKD